MDPRGYNLTSHLCRRYWATQWFPASDDAGNRDYEGWTRYDPIDRIMLPRIG